MVRRWGAFPQRGAATVRILSPKSPQSLPRVEKLAIPCPNIFIKPANQKLGGTCGSPERPSENEIPPETKQGPHALPTPTRLADGRAETRNFLRKWRWFGANQRTRNGDPLHGLPDAALRLELWVLEARACRGAACACPEPFFARLSACSMTAAHTPRAAGSSSGAGRCAHSGPPCLLSALSSGLGFSPMLPASLSPRAVARGRDAAPSAAPARVPRGSVCAYGCRVRVHVCAVSERVCVRVR